MSSPKETAAEVFERINRHRYESGVGLSGSSTPLDLPGDPTRVTPGPVRVRVDEVLFQDPVQDPLSGLGHGPVRPGVGQSPGPSAATTPDPAADRFPRSATMRLILKHPALALGLGLPAAGLLLKSPASRRLLGMAVRVGTGPELQQLIRLTSSGTEPARPYPFPAHPDPDEPTF